MFNSLLVISVVLFGVLGVTEGQSEVGVRLRSEHNDTTDLGYGTVEVLHDGIWSTVCSYDTTFFRIACRTIGFYDAICYGWIYDFDYDYFYSYLGDSSEVYVYCADSATSLDACSISNAFFCYRTLTVACVNDTKNKLPVPVDIKLLSSSTRHLTIGWTAPASTINKTGISYKYEVSYKSMDVSYFSTYTTPSQSSYKAGESSNYTIDYLSRDTEYIVRVRIGFYNADTVDICGSYRSYIYGNYSEAIFSTNSTLKESNYTLRLVSPTAAFDSLGRVEVLYNNTWGTICDDYFYTDEAIVICGMLNFTDGGCAVSRGRLGQGTGPIWIDNLRCSGDDEIIEDCTHLPWGVNSCTHSEDVGVVCTPNEVLPPVENLTVVAVGPSSVILRWSHYIHFPYGAYLQRLQITLTKGEYATNTATVSPSLIEYNFTYLSYETTYIATIRAIYRISSYCYRYAYGESSDDVSFVTISTAPYRAPTQFNVVAINSTSIQVEWELPSYYYRNGIIRGFKIFVRPADGKEKTITIRDNTTDVYALTGLQPATAYTISVLAFTVADGPRTSPLTAVTYKYDPLITVFGINGNGLIKERRYTSTRGQINIYCGVADPTNVTVGWYFANGTAIDTADIHGRSVRFSNGTAILQIGGRRRLSYCDGGVYFCIVNATNTVGRIEEKNFTLLINTIPPPPEPPFPINVSSKSIMIGWKKPVCDGGHVWSTLTIRYEQVYGYGFGRTIRRIDPDRGNYTIYGLYPSTVYSVRIQVYTVDSRTSSYSTSVRMTTLSPAPSAPRDVRASLINSEVVEVRWREPAVPNGVITQYTVYATHDHVTGFIPKDDHGPHRIVRVFKNTTVGNITLLRHSSTYHFQVSASAIVNGVLNEGELSPITANATLFIPEPGIPKPVNITVIEKTNASVSLHWEYPPPPVETIERFMITYSTENLMWRSANGTLYFIGHSGKAYTTSNRVKISPLVPGTQYQFKVSAITAKGRGAEVAQLGETWPSYTPLIRLAHFQLLLGPIYDCNDFMRKCGNASDSTSHLTSARNAVSRVLIHLCPKCGFTVDNIISDRFSCEGGLTTQIVYQARVIGTEVYSAPDLVSLLSTWVANGAASLSVNSSHLRIDPTCPSMLDSFDAPNCQSSTLTTTMTMVTSSTSEGEKPTTVTSEGERPTTVTSKSEMPTTVTPESEKPTTLTSKGERPTTVTSEKPTTVTSKGERPTTVPTTVTSKGEWPTKVTSEGDKPTNDAENEKLQLHNNISVAEVGGLIMGAVIIVLFIVLISLLLLVVLKKWKPRNKRNQYDHHKMIEVTSPFESNRDSMPFDDENANTKATMDDKSL